MNLQAAVSGAVNALLRKHAAAAGAGGADMGRPRLADCVHVLCRWRNRVAQDLDESECLFPEIHLECH